ncbi:hypothetical protein [Hymenobacter guriensis]|uniref:Uncharacterized protein n=1 Tax=Hymenobacter guriensis TaxID=2793065 RepID=A0ABS0L6Z7_9BACT|nr:hypothetical protein [Hymenobacter guriensis]MBG8555903.1 hypothetical protein [Hymenobacter guriensis]
MTFLQFSQSNLLRGTTLLVLRRHGLYVSQRRRNGVAWLESEIPYEELLPVALEYAVPGPLALPRPLLWVLMWLGVQFGIHAMQHGAGLAEWVAVLAFGAGLSLVYLGRRYLGRSVTLSTNRLRLTLRDQPGRRDALENFTDELRRRAHGYLRDEYAQVNPLGPIELQLHRLNWLHHLNVLSEKELRTLSTRLTGRLSLDSIKLMGQDLETPYLN